GTSPSCIADAFTHISSQNVELSQAALQALGFCLLVSLSSLVLGSTEKNTCARALWVISKQNFPSEVVSRKVSDILKTLEAVQTREDIQSVIMEHEALNVVIRLLEQAPTEMGEGAVQWAKLVIPLVVHSASKVRLRAAAALEMGMPLLLEKQQEVAAIIEPLMSSKLIPELQKLFSSKNETNVLKLWPLFVRLLGKLLHRGGPFINSLLHLEELGFRSSSPVIKKIAFIAWKSLIDNFALNPDILCSAKRLKLLMQPLSSVQVRAEALQLTKLEVWWYLVIKLGPNLAANFEQVGVPLLQSAVSTESKILSPTPTRNSSSNVGGPALNSSIATPRMNLNSSVHGVQTFPSIQLLGLEMLLHYFLGPEVTAVAAKHKLQLSLEPLSHPLLASHTHFTKFSGVLVSAVRDGVIGIGKDAPDSLLSLIWKNLVGLVNTAIESGNKKDRQGSEMLTLLLQALQSIVSSESLPALRTLGLLETTVKGIPQKILGSAAYQVANMDILNGTPALFLTLQLFHSSMLHSFVQDERFFVCLETLVSCGLSGPTSPLAFSESVLGVIGRSAELVENKEHLWRMWSIVVSPLTDTIIQTNEVNQGDALEHNFTAVYSALMFPVNHLLTGQALPCATQKSLLSTWSRLYKAFARCSALVATAEENICCEELCAKMLTVMDRKNVSTLDAVASILLVIIECIDFSPYTVKSQQKPKSPRTPSNWVKKKNKVLGNLAAFQTLLVQLLESFLAQEAHMEGTGPSMGGLASVLLGGKWFLSLAIFCPFLFFHDFLKCFCTPLLCRPQNERPYFYSSVAPKLEKLLGDILTCLQTRCVLAYDSELLGLLAPLLCVLLLHKSKGVRSLITQFWNATFANAPGECSQLETKISGVTVKSTGKRGSLLAKAVDRKEKVKLDFGSPKPPRREVLEEEASVDFVFIPPETKERVLTEHQKEVKRTKRVDIPAMYNNLDASLDTTIFSQYSQSQEESIIFNIFYCKVSEEKMDVEESIQAEKMDVEQPPQADIKELSEADISSKMDTSEQEVQAVEVSASDSIQDILATETAEISTDGCNVSASSDVISGTPQKPGSRRQSFITLEKYEDRKTASMGSVTKFTGPLSKPSKGQEATESVAEGEMEETSQGVDRPKRGRPKKQSRSSQQEVIVAVEVEKEAEKEAECKVNNGNDSYSQATDDPDIIPGTQIDSTGKARLPSTETKGNASSEEMKEQLVDSQGSEISSQTEVRRSGRRRSRPLRPGEDREETEDKNKMGRVNVEQGDDMNSKTPPGGSKMNNNSQKASFASNMEVPSQVRPGRKSKVAEPVKDEAKEASQESSQVQGRYKTRRSSQNLLSAIEHSESDGSETREDTQPVKKRGRKPKLLNSDVIVSPKNTQCQQSTHVESVEIGISEASQKEEPKSINSDSGSLEAPQTVSEEVERNSSDPETSISASDSKPATIRSGSTVDEFPTESQPVVPQCTTALTEIVTKSQKVHICPHSNRGRGRRRSRGCHCKVSGSLSQESDVSDSQSNEDQGENRSSQDGNLLSDPSESVCSESKESQIQACTKDAVFVEIDPQVMASVSNNALALGTAETEGKSNISDKDEVEIQNTSQLVDMPCEKIEGAVEDICNDQPEGEEKHENNQEDQCQIIDGLDADAPLQQEDLVAQDEEAHLNSADVAVAFAPAAAASPTMPAELSEPSKPLCMDSPPKQKALEGEADVPDVDQSPSSGKTRGVWSPSASPSTSILKKGQKRPLEEESPSPLLKSRRVSFADPIHHQELADDIDRRSPVIRSSAGSSPKSKNINNVSFQQRVNYSERWLSLIESVVVSLISEMSQEPKPIPKDCVYPALVGCCVPVEAVLPQLSSVWPRGFGHLVRARNIKTVGNLSALTPAEVKSLPIRSPKLSNVKKALKTYHEQQRKGRGDELKGFDETEKMTSEPEERDPPELATDPASEVEAMAVRLTAEELSRCSPGQLVQMHEQLSTLMRNIVVQLQSRLPSTVTENTP
uniref:Replication timing regulatory factor 1 n=1 Tax=Scleropages formosus TaxID=113540 RepID=A0A8C9TB40_SCLFO